MHDQRKLEENRVVADELFNAAKAATKARRASIGRPKSKRIDVTEPQEISGQVDDENIDPNALQSPSVSRNKLTRKSRMIRNRRITQDNEDEEVSRDEDQEVSDVIEDDINEQ